MPKHILIAEPLAGQPRQYVASTTSNWLVEDIAYAAMFDSKNAAEKGAQKLLARDIERLNKVRLVRAEVTLQVLAVEELPRKRGCAGYVIRRADGRYYKGPKSRLPKDFMEAYYRYVANRDVATVFPNEERAREVAEAAREILRVVAEDEKKDSRSSGGYTKIYTDFSYTLEAV